MTGLIPLYCWRKNTEAVTVMPEHDRSISPGVANLVSPELQDHLWAIHHLQPLTPSIFDLRRGHGRYIQHISHLCLLPYYDQQHTVKLSQPALDDIRITVLRTTSGWLMRLSNRLLEDRYGKRSGPEQGNLF